MKYLPRLVLVILSCLLVACGGGGGSAGSSADSSSLGGSGNSVDLFTSAPEAVTVTVGPIPVSYGVFGGSGTGYTAVSSNLGVATVTLTGTTVNVTGVASGTADVVVRDSVGGTVTIAVTVPTSSGSPPSSIPLFSSAPSAITVAVGASPIYGVFGGSGTGYTAASSNASVATMVLANNALTVNGVAPGAANVVVRDSAGGMVTIAVIVPTSGSLPLFTTAPTNVIIALNNQQTYSVGGGIPSAGLSKYSAGSSNVSVATVTANIDGSMVIAGVNVGSAIIYVRDSINTIVPINVTVSQPTTQLQILPATFDVSEQSTNAISLYLYGGTGTYTNALSSEAGLATVGVSGNVLTVAAVSSGGRCITAPPPAPAIGGHPNYQSGTATIPAPPTGTSPPQSFTPVVVSVKFVPVTLTVYDSNGVSATSIMRIIDGAACP